ncbi:MAG: ankyrin repeat domain-containing protein [Bryobacteraceae bacterium]
MWQLAAAGKLERLSEYLDRNPADLNATGTFGTPLHEAILHGRVQVVEYLLSLGADPQARNRHGHTALELAG